MSIIDVTAAPVDRDDPMHYDRMRELANRLRGEYLERADLAADAADAERYERLEAEVWAEARAVDGFDYEAIMRATTSFQERLGKLDRAA